MKTAQKLKPLKWWPSDTHRYLLLTPVMWQQSTEMLQREERERKAKAHRNFFGGPRGVDVRR